MEVPSEYAAMKNGLEERIRSLENEKARLITEIAGLKENIETFKLQRRAKSLDGEVSGLRAEKTAFEGELARVMREDELLTEPAPGTTDSQQIPAQPN